MPLQGIKTKQERIIYFGVGDWGWVGGRRLIGRKKNYDARSSLKIFERMHGRMNGRLYVLWLFIRYWRN